MCVCVLDSVNFVYFVLVLNYIIIIIIIITIIFTDFNFCSRIYNYIYSSN